MSTSRFHLARSARVLAFGGSAMLCGATTLVVVLLQRIAGDGTGWVALQAVLLVLTALFLAGLLRALWRLLHAPTALTMDAERYEVARGLGSGARSAGWSQVTTVESVLAGRSNVVVLRLRSGAMTRIPARLVEEPLHDWTAELDRRLRAVHGQRRR